MSDKNISDYIDKAVCLTIEERYDSWIELKEQCYLIGITPEIFLAGKKKSENDTEVLDLFDHIDIDKLPPKYEESICYPSWWRFPHAFNAWICHHKIIKKAFDEDVETLLLLEDDSEIMPDFQEIFEECRSFIDNNKWDMLYLGWYSNGNLKKIDHKYIYKIEGGAGFHGVILKRNVMKELLKFNPVGPFDWICGKYIHNRYKCYAIYPSIIMQKDGISYIEGGGHLTKPERNSK